MLRFTAVLTALLFSAGLIADEKKDGKEADKEKSEKQIQSGLAKGKGCNPFQVEDVTGPNKGKQLCYVWNYGNAPVALIFTKEIDKDLTGLVKEIDKTLAGSKSAKAFVVLLSDDKKAAHAKLEAVAKENSIKLPLTVNVDGKKAPAAYEVNDKVKHTILIYKEKKVVDNFALNEISADKTKEITASAKKAFEG